MMSNNKGSCAIRVSFPSPFSHAAVTYNARRNGDLNEARDVVIMRYSTGSTADHDKKEMRMIRGRLEDWWTT
jgi:hypothetical protein